MTGNAELVSPCGLYCGECRAFKNEKCGGCATNDKAAWCKIRVCCKDKAIITCAECTEFSDVNDCKKFNNNVAKIIGFLARSNRKACIERIKVKGLQQHADALANDGKMTIKR